uniref:ABC3 transporter permease protein domain-containing protein n=1 Tax=Rhodnius prolixus TaxID=13249 RepID=T1I902_RHOPR
MISKNQKQHDIDDMRIGLMKMQKSLIASAIIAGVLTAPAAFAFTEHPAGEPITINELEIAAVYLQPIDMEPRGMGLPAAKSDIHLEADIHAVEGNKNGFGAVVALALFLLSQFTQSSKLSYLWQGTLIIGAAVHWGDDPNLTALTTTHVVNTDLLLNISAVILAFGWVAFSAVLCSMMARRLPRLRWPLLLLLVALLVLPLSGGLMLLLMKLQALGLTKPRLSFVARVTNNGAALNYFCALLLGLLSAGFMLPLLKTRQQMQATDEAIAKRKATADYRNTRRTFTAALLALLVVTLGQLYWDKVASQPPRLSEAQPVTLGPDSKVHIPIEQVRDGKLHRFVWIADDGKAVRFFVINRYPDRLRLGVVFDACLLCGDQGYVMEALLAVSIDIGDKMARELKSYGANILVEPAGQAALPALFGENSNPLASEEFLDESELLNIKDIFWRNNIVGFAPLLSGDVIVAGKHISVLGTFFSQPITIPDEEDYHTGQQSLSPYWQVTGNWPTEPVSESALLSGQGIDVLAGKQLAQQNGWQVGQTLRLQGPERTLDVRISGILASGGDEENRLVMPLAAVQNMLGLEGKIQAVRVSALTVPENELSRRARENLEALNAEEHDLWYCTAYVSSIAHQLEEAISGSVVRPIWQVAASEGVVIDKIQLLLGVVTFAALVAAAMGIASLMTSTIMERSKEIGLMKALGARQWQIMLLFYLEAAMSGLLGGALGCIAGWGLARAIGLMLFGVPLSFAWVVIPCVLVIAMLIAVIGTWFPARRIARLYPVEVLYGR